MRPSVLGIDPGLKGAWAVLSDYAPQAEPLPFVGGVLDVRTLASQWKTLAPDVVVIERAQAYPKQGVSGAFNYGETYGLLKGIVRMLGFRLELVGPAKWHKALLIGNITDQKEKKDAVIRYVYEAFPSVELVRPGCRKPHDGMADALCLAEYGRRTFLAGEAAA